MLFVLLMQASEESLGESFCEALPILNIGSLITHVHGSLIILLSGNSISFSGSHDLINSKRVMPPNHVDCSPSLVALPNISTSFNLSTSLDSINYVICNRLLPEIYNTTNHVR